MSSMSKRKERIDSIMALLKSSSGKSMQADRLIACMMMQTGCTERKIQEYVQLLREAEIIRIEHGTIFLIEQEKPKGNSA